MKAILDQACGIADPLSQSLALLETQSTSVAADAAQRAIRDVWLMVVDDLADGHANLSSAYLARVHARLTAAAGVADSAGFAEQSLPILPDGNLTSWSRFVEECHLDQADGTEEYALAQIRWGSHVQTFALSLGWIAMNLVRLKGEQVAVYPPAADHERLVKFLEYAGPDSYDAEAGLRGLASEYAEQQAY